MSQNIAINMPDWKHKILLKKIDALKTGMRMFKITEAFKKAFMDDLYSVESIIKNAKTESKTMEGLR